MFVHKDKKIIVKTNTSVDKLTIGNLNLDFAYSIENGEIGNQLDLDSLKKFQTKKKKASIQLVKSEMGHLDTEDYDLMVPPIDLELNYGKDFKKIHKVIIDRLNKTNDKGIILLHGDPGTGKTSYIKYLTSLIKDKDILFIPPSMAEMLSEPTIIPFLMDHKNSILIIEDAERVISDREGNGSPAGVSNILNLTDGILGDCLNIQVIATFNMKREKIDQALLRKGRLIAEHKFERLSVDDTNKLLKSLKKNHTVEEGMVLADIYNIDTEVYKTSSKGNKIGF
jgi:Cdc6-like AAA superfamily ATPase